MMSPEDTAVQEQTLRSVLKIFTDENMNDTLEYKELGKAYSEMKAHQNFTGAASAIRSVIREGRENKTLNSRVLSKIKVAAL